MGMSERTKVPGLYLFLLPHLERQDMRPAWIRSYYMLVSPTSWTRKRLFLSQNIVQVTNAPINENLTFATQALISQSLTRR